MKKDSLNTDQHDKLQQVLDYTFNLDSPAEHQATEALISQDQEARQLHQNLEKTLLPLDALQDEPVPTGLSQRTLERVAQHRQAKTLALSSASIASQKAPVRESRTRWVLANVREWVAVAASIMLISYAMQPGLRQARNQSRQVACLGQMQRAGQSLSSYATANGGFLPHVNFQPGEVWWNVGEKGEQNHSNTRNLYLLVKKGYANPDAFICSGFESKSPKQIPLKAETLDELRDFICRMHVNYSVRLSPEKVRQERRRFGQVIILTDQNPLFVNIDCETPPANGFLDVDDALRQANSPNHRQRGQNVLMLDGSARFYASRFVGENRDDIYTIDKVTRYQGTEMPQSGADIFMAP